MRQLLTSILLMQRGRALVAPAGGWLRRAADALRPAGAPAPALMDDVPTWPELEALVDAATPDAEKRELADIAEGRGPPTASADLRLFDAPAGFEPRVTLYRDGSSWCPYCQKASKRRCRRWASGRAFVAPWTRAFLGGRRGEASRRLSQVWMQLEEKRIPYKVERINMRCYGSKPAWFERETGARRRGNRSA